MPAAFRPYCSLACGVLLFGIPIGGSSKSFSADTSIVLQTQYQTETSVHSGDFEIRHKDQDWSATETAIIVCDVWDYHHSANAASRLNEFVSRLDDVLASARDKGVTIIHSPSDCMPAYENHPARDRAISAPVADNLPSGIADWCSVIPAERRAVYPIDQSDGGADDAPGPAAAWSQMLVDLGRNPHLPWQRQSDKITIDGDRDYISDRGDEVWNVLESHGIKNVILTGVHVNMCVLGRPFGLRQMARNGKNVVLMRDMTDSMYNPASWPYINHYRGNDLIISHIERFVCPTITSDQFIGGKPFRFAGDLGETDAAADDAAQAADRIPYRSHWTGIALPIASSGNDTDWLDAADAPAWYRCVVFSPQSWQEQPFISLDLGDSFSGSKISAFLNGQPLESRRDGGLRLATEHLITNDHNLLVIRVEGRSIAATKNPVLKTAEGQTLLALEGKWQLRIGDDADWSNMPLPAKFGGGSDIVFTPEEPLWTARAVTRPGLFTAGIEGPACDQDGNIFAVNYERQGTIGRVAPDGSAEVFVELPDGSVGNGIRFDRQGFFYVADYTNHQVLKVDPTSRQISVLAKNDSMNQPNDLGIADDGTLFASDPDWAASTGQIWRIDTDGTTTLLAKDMGTTNGIEVSPDGKTLYVNESVQRNVWAFTINKDKTLSDKRLVRKFEDFGFDGMRADVDGNLYITRHGKGTVIKMSPVGEILQEIDVLGTKPSNLCFGGPDGRTVYVTEVDGGRLVSFRVDSPGQSWLRWRKD